MTDEGLTIYETRVPAAWVDYNGHMNDAAYAIAFSHATDRFMDYIGIDAAYRERTRHTIYTLENHICYLLEAKRDEAVQVKAQLLEHDAKRVRVFYVLYRVPAAEPLATSEQMLLHVDQVGPGAAAFDAGTVARLQRLARVHGQLEVPARAGRSIRSLGEH